MLISDDSHVPPVERNVAPEQSTVWRSRLRVLLAVSLLLRILAAFAVDYYVRGEGREFLVEGDANGYWQLAQKIHAGEDFSIHSPPRHVLRVPGFPVLLACSIGLFGDSILAARLVLAAIGAACCWLTYVLGRRLSGESTGFWAALFVALNPIHVGNSVLILSETWFAFWMLLSLIALNQLIRAIAFRNHDTRSADQRRRRILRLSIAAVLVGSSIGLTVMVRPGFLPWLAVVWLVVLLKGLREKFSVALSLRVGVCVLVGGSCLLVMLPWAARNFRVTGHWVLTSLWSGPSMYDGLNPNADGSSDMRFFDDENVMSTMSEFEMNRHYKQRAIDYAMKNPGHAIRLAFSKAGRYLSPVPNFAKGRGWVAWSVCVVLWSLLLAGLFVGAMNRPFDIDFLVITAGPLLLFLLVHMVFVGSVRYRLPLEFPLSVLAANGWQGLAMWLRRSGSVAGG